MRLVKAVITGSASIVVLVGSAGFSTDSAAEPQVVRWHDIRGLSSSVGLNVDNTLVVNLIGAGTGASPPGQRPWSTTSGHAQVELGTGEIDFIVRGLVLAGGVGIGTTSPFTEVVGRLVCDTNGSSSLGNSTIVDTPSVPLSPQGDAVFHGNIEPLPSACSQPDIAFLIVNPSTGRWIAFGAIRTP